MTLGVGVLGAGESQASLPAIDWSVQAEALAPTAAINATISIQSAVVAYAIEPSGAMVGTIPLSVKVEATTPTPTASIISGDGSVSCTVPALTLAPVSSILCTIGPPNLVSTIVANIAPPVSRTNAETFLVVNKKTIFGRRYRAKITGNFTYDFPISSISASFRQTGAGTMTIVCPDGINYGTTIIDQSRVNNHTITIYADEIYSDGTIETSTFIMTSNSLSYAQGARSFSITINGSVSLDIPTTPRQYVAEGIQYETLQGNGGIRIRCDLNKDIRPKDKILITGNRQIDVGIVQYIISSNTRAMEIAETLI
jgi:hypothetical protein